MPIEGLHKHTITARARTCRHMPSNGRFRPISTKWREMEKEAQWGIGGTYRRSPGQMPRELVLDGSAPSLVTPGGRHVICADLEEGGQIWRVAQRAPTHKERTARRLSPTPASLCFYAHGVIGDAELAMQSHSMLLNDAP